ncbi:MAG TPA: transposase domain-containing protein [Streptosporangiaceae bacterium]|nr:transposase domain-containing protein [Streptosporangiaceae bacterium]
MSGQFAMLIAPSSIPPAPSGGGDADAGLRAELAERVLSGPGLWLDWLAELDRASLLEELLAGDAVGRALAGAPHGHAYDRTLTAKMTVVCVLAGCLFPGEGYDGVLATAFGLPGLHLKPGTTVPTGPAFSKARALLGEQVMKRAFELDAARGDAELGIGAAWKGLETTAIDGTTADLFSNDGLADAFGVPAGGSKPQLRIVAHVRTGSRRWIAAAIGGYRDGENALADELGGSFKPGMINLADRGFFSMDRWLRFSAAGAPGLAGQERREIGPVQDTPHPADPSWSCCTNRTACGPGGAARPGTRTPRGCRTPSPGWSASPSPPAPQAAGSRPPSSRC